MTRLSVLNASDMPAARRVWEACFPDDESAFIDYYFQKRTRPEWILGAFSGEKLIGTVHMLPHTVTFFGVEKSVGFVAGVATLPEERGRGVAGNMLNASFEIMRERGFSATMLKPFSQGLARYYEGFGYKPFAHVDVYELTLNGLSGVAPAQTHAPGAGELLKIYNAFAAGLSGMRVRAQKEMELLLEELTTYESALLCDGISYAACDIGGGGAHAFELAGENPLPLLRALCEKYGRVRTHMRAGQTLVPRKSFTREVFNMLKVLDDRAFAAGLPKSVETLFARDAAVFSLEMY
ncbi:MAG: GNAT family N-acetyltransferase [Clostridiaceae bacterium]